MKWNQYESIDGTEQTDKCPESPSGLDNSLVFPPKRQSQLIWKLLTVVLLTVAAYFFAEAIQLRHGEGFSTGYSTELCKSLRAHPTSPRQV